MFSAAFHFIGVLLNSFHCLKNSILRITHHKPFIFPLSCQEHVFPEKEDEKEDRTSMWKMQAMRMAQRIPSRHRAAMSWSSQSCRPTLNAARKGVHAICTHTHTHPHTHKQTLDETNRECRSYLGKMIWLGVGACGVLNLVLKIYQFWNRARPRVLLQNQHTRELISTQKMSPHNNKNWSCLRQLSPGMRANTRYIHCCCFVSEPKKRWCFTTSHTTATVSDAQEFHPTPSPLDFAVPNQVRFRNSGFRLFPYTCAWTGT